MPSQRITHRAKEPVITGIGDTGIMSFKVTCGATGTDVVRFADYGLPDMKDAAYTIQLGGETAAKVHVDESETIPGGFTILHTGAAEKVHVTVQGHIVGLPAIPILD
jgi:hypothetical protein